MMKKKTLRIISLLMLIAVIVFVICALPNSGFGSVTYIGTFRFGPEQWRVCYVVYLIIMVGLFAASFFPAKRRST